MSAQSNIVINDGQGTPVAHTFNPKGARAMENGKSLALWRDQSPASAVGFLTIKEEHVPVNTNGVEKFRYVIDVPTLESPASGGSFAPPPTRAYGSIAVIEVWAHQRASKAELENIVAYVKNFTSLAYFKDAVSNREPAW